MRSLSRGFCLVLSPLHASGRSRSSCAEALVTWEGGGVGRRLEADQAEVGLERRLRLPEELRLGGVGDDEGGAGLLVPAVA